MCNRIKLYAWVILITVFIFSFSPSKAYAFVMPAIDFQSIILNVKQLTTRRNVQNVKKELIKILKDVLIE